MTTKPAQDPVKSVLYTANHGSDQLRIELNEPGSGNPITLNCNVRYNGNPAWLELPRQYASVRGAKQAAARLVGGGLRWEAKTVDQPVTVLHGESPSAVAAMNGSKAVTVELPPVFLSNLEAYVRSLEVFLGLPPGTPIAECESADDMVRTTSIVVLSQLMDSLHGLNLGTLSEAIAEHRRNIQARAKANSTSSTV